MNGVRMYLSTLLIALTTILPLPPVPTTPVTWNTSYARAYFQAKNERKLLLVHISLDTCGPCRKIEDHYWPRQDTQRVLKKYVCYSGKADEEPWPGCGKTWQEYARFRRVPFEAVVDTYSFQKARWLKVMVPHDTPEHYRDHLDVLTQWTPLPLLNKLFP
jgi:hypothetical protein